MHMERRIDRLHWREFKKLVPEKIANVIVPVGIIEAHGASALGTDVLIPERLAQLAAEKAGALVAPPIAYGVPGGLDGYPGSLGVRAEIFAEYLQDVLHSLANCGFRHIFVLNGHGGNNLALKEVAQAVFQATGVFVAVIHWWIEAADLTREVYGGAGGHGGADETGLMLAIDPALVRHKEDSSESAWIVKPSVITYPAPSSLLVYGDDAAPISVDPDRARTYMKRVSGRIAEIIEDLEARWSEI
jgi:creatinine amidohydrolase